MQPAGIPGRFDPYPRRSRRGRRNGGRVTHRGLGDLRGHRSLRVLNHDSSLHRVPFRLRWRVPFEGSRRGRPQDQA
ncbi:hypothetical protein GCM10009780_69820 [Actinomadura alba]